MQLPSVRSLRDALARRPRRSHPSILVAALLFTALATPSSPASAQDAEVSTDATEAAGAAISPQAMRISAYLSLGIAGGVGKDELDYSAAPGVGLGGRFELPIHPNVLIGGQLELAWWRADDGFMFPERNTLVDLDLLVRGRYAFDAGGMAMEVYGVLPIGLTLSFLDAQNNGGDADTSLGWNTGLLGGVQIFFTDRIAALAELGFRMHRMTHERPPASYGYSLMQPALNLGAVFLLP
ncbi:MAG: hypothetical protein OEY14_02790 [Myxococcales bacterium]|nr:hypothetical protein [Myxococcales bacterium]